MTAHPRTDAAQFTAFLVRSLVDAQTSAEVVPIKVAREIEIECNAWKGDVQKLREENEELRALLGASQENDPVSLRGSPREERSRVSPEQQRIALAKAITPFFERHPCDCDLMGDGDGGWKEIPEYFTDLNAIRAAAQQMLTKETWKHFVIYLYHVQCGNFSDPEFRPNLYLDENHDWHHAAVVELCQATAAHWCEALLRTLGKWRG